MLILRIVSFEWRDRVDQSAGARRGGRGRTRSRRPAAPLLWGIVFANLLHGVPINSSQDFAGSFGDLFSGYTVLAGVTLVVLFAFHGAVFLGLRTTADLRRRARELAWPLGLVAGDRRRRRS